MSKIIISIIINIKSMALNSNGWRKIINVAIAILSAILGAIGGAQL